MSDVSYPRLIKRVRAVLIDSVIMSLVVMGMIMLGAALSIKSPMVNGLLMVVPIFILEPALVSFTGGTVGHHMMNLRVTRLGGVGNVNIVSATLRFILKVCLGWLSFVFVLTTVRHQALHDIISRSIVVHKSKDGLAGREVLTERQFVAAGFAMAPTWRRLFMIFVYCVLLLIAIGVASAVSMSDACIQAKQCAAFDSVAGVMLNLLWILGTGGVIVQGWRGRLFGCRNRPISN